MMIDSYIQKRAQFVEVQKQRDAMIKLVCDLGSSMQRSPDTFHFSNTSGGGYPAEIALSRAAPSFDTRQWPTADQLHAVLVKWHEAKHALNSAWSALTQEQKQALQPPPYSQSRMVA